MNYVEWCGRFLARLTAAILDDPQSHGYTNLALLAQQMFGLEPTQGYGDEYRQSALHTAVRDLQTLGLTAPHGTPELWGITETGARLAGDLSSLWG